MSFIRVRDQFGNPPPPSGRIDVALIPQGFTSPQDRRFTDDAGNVSFTGCTIVWPDAHGVFMLAANTANVNPAYGNATVTTQNIEAAPIDLVIQKLAVGPGCPVNYDKAQFTTWFNAIKVGNTVTREAMIAMTPAVHACGFEWQNDCRPNTEWRPRIHQPPFLNGPCSGSTHDVDLGDFGGPWTLTFRY